MSYTGLNEHLRHEVLTRDGFRCRWCGRTNAGLDLHHVRYRRGVADDVADNLIALCRTHHGYVHGIPTANGATLVKDVAQQILREAIVSPGTTGSAILRARRAQWRREGRCERHGLVECALCPAAA